MVRTEIRGIASFADHPEAEVLRDYDYPTQSLRRWRATLAAKAWIGPALGCFFVGGETAERYVLLFDASNKFAPRFHGSDMRLAETGSSFELDVFAVARGRPVTDAAIPIKGFP